MHLAPVFFFQNEQKCTYIEYQNLYKYLNIFEID